MDALELDATFDSLDVQDAFIAEGVCAVLRQPFVDEALHFIQIQRFGFTEKDGCDIVVMVMIFFFEKANSTASSHLLPSYLKRIL